MKVIATAECDGLAQRLVPIWTAQLVARLFRPEVDFGPVHDVERQLAQQVKGTKLAKLL